MSEFLQVIVLALMPAVDNFVGGLVAEVIVISRHRLGIALHAAAGIVLAVIAVELMPRALNGEPTWVTVAAFVAGGIGDERILLSAHPGYDVPPAGWRGTSGLAGQEERIFDVGTLECGFGYPRIYPTLLT